MERGVFPTGNTLVDMTAKTIGARHVELTVQGLIIAGCEVQEAKYFHMRGVAAYFFGASVS